MTQTTSSTNNINYSRCVISLPAQQTSKLQRISARSVREYQLQNVAILNRRPRKQKRIRQQWSMEPIPRKPAQKSGLKKQQTERFQNGSGNIKAFGVNVILSSSLPVTGRQSTSTAIKRETEKSYWTFNISCETRALKIVQSAFFILWWL